MTLSIVCIVLVIGASGLIAQAVLVRELLCVFYGNELTLGLILGGWLLAEALGAATAGYAVERVKNRNGFFLFLQLVFCLALPLAVLAARWARSVLGVPPGTGLGAAQIGGIALVTLFPSGYAHGALFSASCAAFIVPQSRDHLPEQLTRLYVWEAAGTMAGGLIFTFILIGSLDAFQISRAVIASNVLISALFIYRFCRRATTGLMFAALPAMAALLFLPPGYLQQRSLAGLFPGQSVLEMRSSAYATVAATRSAGQTTVYYNGLPAVVAPDPDRVFIEEFSRIPAAFHAQPHSVLLAGAGAGGMLAALVQQPFERIDYVELDPVLIQMARKHAPSVFQAEPLDPRVDLIIDDARRFLGRGQRSYDLILIGSAHSADLTSNRLFTQESFSLFASRLNSGGILAFWLPGAPAYISAEVRDVTRVVLNAASGSFRYLRVIPGDYFLVIACADAGIADIQPQELSRRLLARGTAAGLLTGAYLANRLDVDKERWLRAELARGSVRTNRDERPLGLFESMRVWNRRFPSPLTAAYAAAGSLPLWAWIAAGLLFWTAIRLCVTVFPARSGRIVLAYTLGQSGFWAMAMSLTLMFWFQNIHGTLYQAIGLTIAVFMSGVAAGGLIAMRLRTASRFGPAAMLVAIELICAAVTFVIAFAFPPGAVSVREFLIVFAVSGLLLGLVFPLAAGLVVRRGGAAQVAGELFAADVAGGWIAGMIGGSVLLPVLGLRETLVFSGVLRAGSAFQLIFSKINKKKI